jgi:hypothetical protein
MKDATMDKHSLDSLEQHEKQEHAEDELEQSNAQAGTDDTNVAARDVHGIKWALVVASLISATFLWGLDGTITADMQATFVRDFNSIDKLAYNSVAFFLGAAACVLTWYAAELTCLRTTY